MLSRAAARPLVDALGATAARMTTAAGEHRGEHRHHAAMHSPEHAHSATICTADGYILSARVFRAPAGVQPRGVVVINSATAVAQKYYAPFAAHLAGAGFETVTYDYRGIGGSAPSPDNNGGRLSPRRFAGSMRDWAYLDYPAVMHHVDAEQRWRGLPLFVVGHSFGGQAFAIADCPARARVRAAVLVASQIGDYRTWPMPSRLLRMFQWYVVLPLAVHVAGHVPGWAGLGENLPGRVALEWAGWCKTPGYVFGAHPQTAAVAAAFAGPVLSYEATDDPFGPPDAVSGLLSRLTSAAVERRVLRPSDHGLKAIGHFEFFRKRSADKFWDGVVSWLSAQAAPQSKL